MSQKAIIRKALREYPKTMLMTAIQTGIMRSNVTEYIRQLKEQGLVFLVKVAPCKASKSGRCAGYYSTNEKFRSGEPDIPQLNLPFDD
jgi:hypothetical protein